MGRVLTLLYHRVNSLENDINLLSVSTENFYNHMKFLKENYHIVKFEDNWNEISNDAVCITFDDGYADNYENAIPILKELHIPATIFVTTGNINTKEEYWWDELERNLLLEDVEYKKKFKLQDELFSCEWLTDTYEKRRELYNTLHWLMYSKVNVLKRKDWLEQLREWNGFNLVGRKINYSMSIEQCLSLPKELITIGAHTVNHPSLGIQTKEEQKYEIEQSKYYLEKLLKYKITTFSYPFGKISDYNEDSINICKECGIKKAASNFAGLWTGITDDFQIPRNIIRDWEIDDFKKQILTFWECK